MNFKVEREWDPGAVKINLHWPIPIYGKKQSMVLVSELLLHESVYLCLE